jgi:uncharacterized protein YceK
MNKTNPILESLFEAVIAAAIYTICALLLLAFSGCSSLHSTTTSPDGSKTTVRAFTLFDGNSDLAKFKNSAGGTNKASGTSIGSLSESSNSTNLVPVISGVAEGVIRGLGAAAK